MNHQDDLEKAGVSPAGEENELTPEQQAEQAAAALLAQTVYDRTAQNLVAPRKWLLKQQPQELEAGLFQKLLREVDEENPREELKNLALIKGKKDSYYYDASIMTPEFAKVQALIEDKDMLATIAEVTRRDCELYPRPAPFSKFAGYPFRFSMDELEGAAARMQLSEEYRDIGVVKASNGASAFYSSKSMSMVYARSLFEEIEVESREWQ